MLRWRIIFLVSIAIAVSYLDRQTLPVAIKALEQDIPINNQQFALLQTAFLFAPGGPSVADERGDMSIWRRIEDTAKLLMNLRNP